MKNTLSTLLSYFSEKLASIAYNVPVVYDVFAVAIKEREAFQQPQKCARVRRGNEVT
jgi:hypothetical protein